MRQTRNTCHECRAAKIFFSLCKRAYKNTLGRGEVVPEAIIKAELWDVFGSRSEYLMAPLEDAIEQRCRIIARHEAQAEKDAEVDA